MEFVGSLEVPENEKAWKDTARVNPTEKVTIAARFDGFAGRYVYHCHVLEHEDHDAPDAAPEALGPDLRHTKGSVCWVENGIAGLTLR